MRSRNRAIPGHLDSGQGKTCNWEWLCLCKRVTISSADGLKPSISRRASARGAKLQIAFPAFSDTWLPFAIPSPTIWAGFPAHLGKQVERLSWKELAPGKRAKECQMKVKSYTYERNWTGKYYRQRLLPSMQTMDRHIASLLNEGWEIMTESSHSGNSRGFRPFAKRDTITVSFRKPQ